ADSHVSVAELLEHAAGTLRELGEQFDGVDFTCDLSQYGRLIPGSGADLENSIRGRDHRRLRQIGDDEWLGDRLAEADRERAIVIREVTNRLRHEVVTRDTFHRVE